MRRDDLVLVLIGRARERLFIERHMQCVCKYRQSYTKIYSYVQANTHKFAYICTEARGSLSKAFAEGTYKTKHAEAGRLYYECGL